MGKTAKSTELAKPETTSLAVIDGAVDYLDELLGDVDLGTDGLEEVDNSDISLPVKVFNMKGKDANGRAIAPDTYYDTITEQTADTIDAVLLTMHKTNEWTKYDEDKGKNVKICRSADRVTGVMQDGTRRACKGCKDAEWTADETGKRTKNCGTVANVVGVDRLTSKPFIVRMKKTGLRPWKNYLNKHFIGARGRKGNAPLFAFQTTIGLEMSDDGKYSLPTFERGAMLDKNSIVEAAGTAKFYREIVLPANVEAFADAENNVGADGESSSAGTKDEFSDDPVVTTGDASTGDANGGTKKLDW